MSSPTVKFHIEITKTPATVADEAVTIEQISDAVTDPVSALFSAPPIICVKKVE
jgi:hypothetical protein